MRGPRRKQIRTKWYCSLAHFDSWDPAQGANDNGAEVATVLEAARILKLLKIQPRHTIRFVFFSGEEQSDLGSRAYVAQHKQEVG